MPTSEEIAMMSCMLSDQSVCNGYCRCHISLSLWHT